MKRDVYPFSFCLNINVTVTFNQSSTDALYGRPGGPGGIPVEKKGGDKNAGKTVTQMTLEL